MAAVEGSLVSAIPLANANMPSDQGMRGAEWRALFQEMQMIYMAGTWACTTLPIAARVQVFQRVTGAVADAVASIVDGDPEERVMARQRRTREIAMRAAIRRRRYTEPGAEDSLLAELEPDMDQVLCWGSAMQGRQAVVREALKARFGSALNAPAASMIAGAPVVLFLREKRIFNPLRSFVGLVGDNRMDQKDLEDDTHAFHLWQAACIGTSMVRLVEIPSSDQAGTVVSAIIKGDVLGAGLSPVLVVLRASMDSSLVTAITILRQVCDVYNSRLHVEGSALVLLCQPDPPSFARRCRHSAHSLLLEPSNWFRLPSPAAVTYMRGGSILSEDEREDEIVNFLAPATDSLPSVFALWSFLKRVGLMRIRILVEGATKLATQLLEALSGISNIEALAIGTGGNVVISHSMSRVERVMRKYKARERISQVNAAFLFELEEVASPLRLSLHDWEGQLWILFSPVRLLEEGSLSIPDMRDVQEFTKRLNEVSKLYEVAQGGVASFFTLASQNENISLVSESENILSSVFSFGCIRLIPEEIRRAWKGRHPAALKAADELLEALLQVVAPFSLPIHEDSRVEFVLAGTKNNRCLGCRPAPGLQTQEIPKLAAKAARLLNDATGKVIDSWRRQGAHSVVEAIALPVNHSTEEVSGHDGSIPEGPGREKLDENDTNATSAGHKSLATRQLTAGSDGEPEEEGSNADDGDDCEKEDDSEEVDRSAPNYHERGESHRNAKVSSRLRLEDQRENSPQTQRHDSKGTDESDGGDDEDIDERDNSQKENGMDDSSQKDSENYDYDDNEETMDETDGSEAEGHSRGRRGHGVGAHLGNRSSEGISRHGESRDPPVVARSKWSSERDQKKISGSLSATRTLGGIDDGTLSRNEISLATADSKSDSFSTSASWVGGFFRSKVDRAVIQPHGINHEGDEVLKGSEREHDAKDREDQREKRMTFGAQRDNDESLDAGDDSAAHTTDNEGEEEEDDVEGEGEEEEEEGEDEEEEDEEQEEGIHGEVGDGDEEFHDDEVGDDDKEENEDIRWNGGDGDDELDGVDTELDDENEDKDSDQHVGRNQNGMQESRKEVTSKRHRPRGYIAANRERRIRKIMDPPEQSSDSASSRGVRGLGFGWSFSRPPNRPSNPATESETSETQNETAHRSDEDDHASTGSGGEETNLNPPRTRGFGFSWFSRRQEGFVEAGLAQSEERSEESASSQGEEAEPSREQVRTTLLSTLLGRAGLTTFRSQQPTQNSSSSASNSPVDMSRTHRTPRRRSTGTRQGREWNSEDDLESHDSSSDHPQESGWFSRFHRQNPNEREVVEGSEGDDEGESESEEDAPEQSRLPSGDRAKSGRIGQSSWFSRSKDDGHRAQSGRPLMHTASPESWSETE
uniref:Uncharacterized protein n=1 Tax=Compsopogon caeruleus TaxID=31354 RepID=A0A6T6BJG6_9RHOD